MSFKTYAEAAKNRKRDEVTILDVVTGLYANIKQSVYPEGLIKKEFLRNRRAR